MRHQPIGIDAIARKAAAQMVVNTALTDFTRCYHHRRAHGRVAAELGLLPDEFIQEWLREFRRAREPALVQINMCAEVLRRTLRQIGGHGPARIGLGFGAQALRQSFAIGLNFVRRLAPDAADFSQYLQKARAPILRIFGKICAAPKRRAIAIKTNGQGPAALLAHHGQRAHIYFVQIGALFAVELDADEIGVHQRRHFFVFKAFMRHHMTPMARCIANGQKHRHIAPPRLGKHRRLPGLPMHRIVFMLQQIRAGRLGQPIACKCAIAFVGHVGQVTRNLHLHKTV